MKGLVSLFLGIFGTFTFSWLGLTVIPNLQIGHLDPQMDEEGTDVYPAPKSGMAERGRRVYVANGCNYCHSQWLRADYAAADIDRKWGQRRSAPRDYIFDRPVLLGKTRMGPDLSNVGQRAPAAEESPSPAAGASPGGSPAAAPAPSPATATAASPAKGGPSPAAAASPATPPASPAPAAGSQAPKPAPPAAVSPGPSPKSGAAPAPPAPGAPSANAAPAAPPASTAVSSVGAESKPGEPAPYSEAWHHRHLYSPRSITLDSNMPAYRFLYEKRRLEGEPSADALKLTGKDTPPVGWEIVPTYDATCLVAYLMSLNQSHPLKEVKSAPATAGSPAAAASPAPASASPPAASPGKGGQ